MCIGIPSIMVTVTGGTDDDNDGIYDVMMGDNFTISCMLSCPTATVTWAQRGTIISTGPSEMGDINGFSVMYTTNADEEITESVLTRNMAEIMDSGIYECAATVQNNRMNDIVAINVYGKYSCLLYCLLYCLLCCVVYYVVYYVINYVV